MESFRLRSAGVSIDFANLLSHGWFTGDSYFTAEGMDPSALTAGIHTDMR